MNNCVTPKRDANRFAINLYNCFQKINKSIEDIAYDLGVEPRTVYYWTSGQRTPNLATIVEITNYLSVTVDDLLVWEVFFVWTECSLLISDFQHTILPENDSSLVVLWWRPCSSPPIFWSRISRFCSYGESRNTLLLMQSSSSLISGSNNKIPTS